MYSWLPTPRHDERQVNYVRGGGLLDDKTAYVPSHLESVSSEGDREIELCCLKIHLKDKFREVQCSMHRNAVSRPLTRRQHETLDRPPVTEI
jgi:hypothetical protein